MTQQPQTSDDILNDIAAAIHLARQKNCRPQHIMMRPDVFDIVSHGTPFLTEGPNTIYGIDVVLLHKIAHATWYLTLDRPWQDDQTGFQKGTITPDDIAPSPNSPQPIQAAAPPIPQLDMTGMQETSLWGMF